MLMQLNLKTHILMVYVLAIVFITFYQQLLYDNLFDVLLYSLSPYLDIGVTSYAIVLKLMIIYGTQFLIDQHLI